jgi:hypothetical protein
MHSNKYYNQGLKAKQLLNIYKNPYLRDSYEYKQWDLGFRNGVYEDVNFQIELEDCSEFIDEFEPLNIEPRGVNHD